MNRKGAFPCVLTKQNRHMQDVLGTYLPYTTFIRANTPLTKHMWEAHARTYESLITKFPAKAVAQLLRGKGKQGIIAHLARLVNSKAKGSAVVGWSHTLLPSTVQAAWLRGNGYLHDVPSASHGLHSCHRAAPPSKMSSEYTLRAQGFWLAAVDPSGHTSAKSVSPCIAVCSTVYLEEMRRPFKPCSRFT
jgi:hypothetical protein